MGFILFSPVHTFMPITEIYFSRILLKIIGIISFLFTVIKESVQYLLKIVTFM